MRPPRSGRTSSVHRLAAILILPMLAACGGPVAKAQPKQTPVAAVQTSPSPVASPTTAAPESHVFVIVMENRSYEQALAPGSYTAKLAAQYSVATNYHGVTHPSLPNYLALTSGSTWGVADDGYHRLPLTGLGQQLTSAGIPWRAYMEGMSGTCFASPYPYALKHNPFGYYGGACPDNVVPFTRFSGDMAGGNVPRFVWITPGLCNDGHDCSTAVADRYLSQVVPEILNSPAWQDHGVLFITWDEGEDAYNHVLTLVIAPGGTAQKSSAYHDHYSLLATIEDTFGLPRMGQAAGATPLRELLVSGSA